MKRRKEFDEEAICKDYNSGLEVEIIRDKYGLCYYTLYAILEEHRVPKRSLNRGLSGYALQKKEKAKLAQQALRLFINSNPENYSYNDQLDKIEDFIKLFE